VSRVGRALAALDREQRFAGASAIALLVTMFLPWYEKNLYDPRLRDFRSDTISAFGTISFVEAAVFLVAAGVLVLLFARGERRGFHLPGGDGTIIMLAGLWAALLIFWRVFDRPEASGQGSTVGIQWGFFLAFLAAAALTATGYRIRAAARPEPPLPQSAPPPEEEDATAPTEVVPRRRRAPVDDEGATRQLSLDEPPERPA
jgi:hypothetical protein